MDFKEFAENLEIREDEFLDLLMLFLKKSASNLEKLKSTIMNGDAVTASETAHSIKGTAITLRLTEIFELAKEMETKAQGGQLKGLDHMVGAIQEKLDKISEEVIRVRGSASD